MSDLIKNLQDEKIKMQERKNEVLKQTLENLGKRNTVVTTQKLEQLKNLIKDF